MKKISRKTFNFIILSFFLFLCPFVVNAASATIGFSGNSNVYIGNTITIKMYISNVADANGGIVSAGGNLSFDSNCLEYISGVGTNSPYTFQINEGANYQIAGLDTSLANGITGSGQTTVFTFTFKAKQQCNTRITLNNAKVSDTVSPINASVNSKIINVTNPPSSNNNLSSLSVSVGNINFNKNTTSYSLSVGSDVTSVSISANSEDGGAKINGTGSKSLSYGSNRFDIVVTAPSGVQKTYTVNITRKDDRSSNNNLSSLKVNGGDLKPGFNKSTTKYSLSVPYSVSSLNVDAKTEDSKAKVTVSGNKGLEAESTKDVTITVTAENGSKKIYTISVSRGKDPNKKLSDNNYLSHLSVSTGILSPVFNKETTNYEVWLPYEIDKISFDYGVEDTKYATIKFEGNDTLQAGVANVYKIIVKAESEEERTYTISVRRAKNPNESTSSNTYLKSIKLKNGSIIGSFDKEIHEYYYIRNKGFDIKEVVPEDENSAVTTYEDGNTIYFIVTSSSGEYGVYTLREKETSVISYILYVLLFIGGFLVGFITNKILKSKNKDDKKEKKIMKKTKKDKLKEK